MFGKILGEDNRVSVYNTDLWCKEKGCLTIKQSDKLRDLIDEIKPKYVVETGFFTGRSASTMLYYNKDLIKMISFEIRLEPYSEKENWEINYEKKMADLLRDKYKNFNIVLGDTNKTLSTKYIKEKFPNGIDWATIDGDHSYEGCLYDLQTLSPHINKNGIIIIDDYDSGINNIDLDVNDFMKNYENYSKGIIPSVDKAVDFFYKKNQNYFKKDIWRSNYGEVFCILKRIRIDNLKKEILG